MKLPTVFNNYERRRLQLLAKCCHGKTVLDIGYAQLPNPFFENLHRTGVDLWHPIAQSVHYEEELTGDVNRIYSLLSGRLFDNIVAGEFIEHIESPYEFLRSVKPLLSQDGRLILSTPNLLAFPVVVCEYLRNKRVFYTPDHRYYFSPRWVERMLDMSGYDVVRVVGVGLWNPFVWLPCPASLSYQVVYVAHPRVLDMQP